MEDSGVVAQNGWAVNYNSKSFCALKGSAVTIECTYTPPNNHSVQKAFWTKELVTSVLEPPDLSDDPEYRGRVQYLGDEQQDCALKLRNVSENDQSKYYFTFITDQPGGKYQGEGGVDLSVTDLQVEVPERVIEGDNVTLTCKTTCSLTVRPTFTWYRNGHPLSSSTDQLHLQLVSREDAGRYRCAVLGLNSPEVTLNVRYGPKSVSVSISPSGEIVEGSSVNLTCSSDANPPVQNYTWFKEGGSSPVGSGHSYSVQPRGSYYCVAQNEYGSQKSAALKRNHHNDVAVRSTASDTAPDPDPSNQDDVPYASVVPLRVRNPRNAESSAVTASAFGTDEEVQYASVQHRRDKVVENTEGDNIQYASVRFTRSGVTNRSAVSTLDEVIYSSMK
ncbi:sialoadhesin-like [Colossoma macropomum]|uniref:sialoadhesin-like n=1 Tax=Colossoma macropomum TaxID=42526 RepID=UPI0018647CA0|nr:sialoadhesin-like [Colossoma macropomum]